MLLFIWAEPRGGGHSARVQGGRHWKEVESREKEDISLELVSAGRGWAPFQLAWQLYQGMCVTGGLGGAMHRASAQRQSNVISPMDWGVVCPPFTTLKVFPLSLPPPRYCCWPQVTVTSLCMPAQVYICVGIILLRCCKQKTHKLIPYL